MKSKLLVSLGLSLSIMAAPAFADDESGANNRAQTPFEQLQAGEHVSVGTEPLPPELQEQMENERVEKYQKFKSKSDQKTAHIPSTMPQANTLCAHGVSAQTQMVSYSHAMHRHYLIGVSYDGRFIDTEDGSRWEIAPSDAYKVLRWRGDETYLITPNDNWLYSSEYPYTIVNQQRGSSARSKLILGPSSEGENVHWIINYDPYLRLVYLENGTVWNVAEDDYPYFARWQVNHIVIIGNYSPWFYFFYPYDSILINVNMNHYVHAKQK